MFVRRAVPIWIGDGWEDEAEAGVGGNGAAGTLPMSDTEKRAAAKRKRPLGFAPPDPKPQRTRRR